MDADVREMIGVLKNLVKHFESVPLHMKAIDRDCILLRELIQLHDARLTKIERGMKFEPIEKSGESSALFQAVKPPPV